MFLSSAEFDHNMLIVNKAVSSSSCQMLLYCRLSIGSSCPFSKCLRRLIYLPKKCSLLKFDGLRRVVYCGIAVE